MRKRIISMLLTVCMLLSAMPVTTVPAYADPGAAPEWISLSGDIGTFTISSDGSYYLSGYTKGNIIVNPGVEATLDLNGQVLNGNGENGVVFLNGYIDEDNEANNISTKLDIKDSGTGTHYFKVDSDGLWVYQEGFSGTADYTFDNAEGLRKEEKTAAEIPAEDDVIEVAGGCITGGKNGGVYANSEGFLTMTGGSVVGNSSVLGGGIYVNGQDSKEFSIANVNCIGNKASAGGGIRIDEGKLTITDCNVSYNVAYLAGGVGTRNSAVENKLVIMNSRIIGNEADDDIGGVYAHGELEMNDCIVSRNTSGTRGAGIGIDDQAILTDCVVSDNTAQKNGGGIFVAMNADLTITGGAVSGNETGDCGGGLYVDSAINAFQLIGKAILRNVVLSGNKAKNGGAVGLGIDSQLLMEGCTVEKNTAAENGGGIYKPGGTRETYDAVADDRCVLLDTAITGNTAGVNGGVCSFRHPYIKNRHRVLLRVRWFVWRTEQQKKSRMSLKAI